MHQARFWLNCLWTIYVIRVHRIFRHKVSMKANPTIRGFVAECSCGMRWVEWHN